MPFTRISLFYEGLKSNLKIIFLQDRILLILFFISLLFNLLLYLGFYWQIKPTAEPIVLHYNIYFGIDLIGEWYKVYIIPAVGSFIFLVNFSLIYFFYKQEKIISYLLTGTTLLIELLLLVSGVMIIWINL